MALIDEDGNIFGVVNIVDALVVLMLLAVVVAGVALVMGTGGESGAGDSAGIDGESETRYVTFELGEQPDYVAERLAEGTVATIGGTNENVTVTDVYVTAPPPNEGPEALVRAEVDGTTRADAHNRDVFVVDDHQLRLGTSFQLDTGWYSTNGTVTAIDTDGETLNIESTTTTATVELSNIEPAVANEFSENMTETAYGETVATVTAVERESATIVAETEEGELYETEHPQNEDVTLTVELATTERDGVAGVYFRGDRLTAGSTIALDLESTTVSGTVTDLE
ncbi:hypothetical protein C482_13570 [Natrialba chahannaoensis JCM 10990]|uniref:DUF4330 domain-containing protein n=1 Tax=Natrialba chahannaoensis JCM 10990 TaxID=1227492 RepID=M0AFU6_9EURY|nr:DUF4330 family protein [Natrialba chahannaoensis]ELY97266.1 hypothetical protein C482_13570 [Natrialba chahannaoensis JCM 10990]